MSTLKDLKDYLESGPLGRKVPLAELKNLSAEDREDLCGALDKLTPEDRAK